VRPHSGLRTLQVAWLVLRHGLVHLARRPGGDSGPQRLRRLLEDLGGAYLKLGQLLALQPDILPARYCDVLFDLRSPPRSLRGRRTDVHRGSASPRPRSSSGSSRRPPPLRSAKSTGRLPRPDGGGHARPGETASGDLRLFERIDRVVTRRRLRRLERLTRMIEDAPWTREELDYRFEARYMGALAFNARDNPGESVPESIPELSSRRILVSSYLDGPTVLEFMRFQRAGSRDEAMTRQLAALGFDADVFARNPVRTS
jgi:ubiquinone biosynthesis protein